MIPWLFVLKNFDFIRFMCDRVKNGTLYNEEQNKTPKIITRDQFLVFKLLTSYFWFMLNLFLSFIFCLLHSERAKKKCVF